MKVKIIFDLRSHILYIYENNKLIQMRYGSCLLDYESLVSEHNSRFLERGRAYRQLSEVNKREMRTLLISP